MDADFLLRQSVAEVRQVLDGCGDASKKKEADKARPVLDGGTYAVQDVRARAAATVQQWCESGQELGEGEGLGDRLIAMLIGIADADKSGELSEAEQAVYGMAAEAAWEYMSGKGATDADLEALFNAEDPEVYNAAGSRVCDLLAGSLPSGDDASLDDLDGFAFGADAIAPALDAAYKKEFAIRQGKKVRVSKRVSGSVHLSGAQKVAIRKAQAKSHSAAATMHRMKSAAIGRRMGLNKG